MAVRSWVRFHKAAKHFFFFGFPFSALRHGYGSLQSLNLSHAGFVYGAVPGELEWWHPLVALGVAGAVTGARQALLQTWPAFAASTDRSNTQVCIVLQLTKTLLAR